MSQQVYCSLDLEFTGFDVTKDQILEVGFAFFRLGPDGAEIIEEWSQVFRPTVNVHPKIFGLTGITPEELETAPAFGEYREFLQEKLGTAILVGHNPVMDVKFLENSGIKLSGAVIDTLELVQFLLPTHHSYNLENLMHYFGVTHEDSHRALGDSKTTIAILTSLLRLFHSLNEDLKNELQKVIERGEFTWTQMLQHRLSPLTLKPFDSLQHLHYHNVAPLTVSDKKVWLDTSAHQHEARVVQGCIDSEQKYLVAVASPIISLRLWQSGLGQAVFSPEDTFSEQSFRWFLDNAQSNEELRFALKVLVWRHTNWQTTTVLDLNISFFGGQYKNQITGSVIDLPRDKVLVCDYTTLSELSARQQTIEHKLVICGLQDFERYISSGNDTKLTWNGLLYTLKNIYNPETGLGEASEKDLVMEALVGTDLFFGLLAMLTKKHFPNQLYVELKNFAEQQPLPYRRMRIAAGNLATRLESLAKRNGAYPIGKAVGFLNEFFVDRPARVRWVMMEEDNGVLCDQPLEIKQVTQDILEKFPAVTVTETVFTGHLLSYLCERIGLSAQLSDIPNIATNHFELPHLVLSDELNVDSVLESLHESAMPAILVMPTLPEVKRFYDANYRQIKTYATIYAQGYSGGINKMVRNFGLRKNSLLVVTADFFARHPAKISAKTILFNGLPGTDTTHPYIAALIEHWKPKFPNVLELLHIAKIAAVIKQLANPQETEILIATKEKPPFEVITTSIQ